MPLEGETTRLRAVDPSDAGRAYRWVNDREVTEHVSLIYPMSMAAERDWAERASRRNTYSDVTFAIEIAATGEHIGVCELRDGHPVDRHSELGVMIGAKAHWGKGYGFDALRTLITFGFRDMNLRRIMLRVLEDHNRAIALYGRLGFQPEGRQRVEHWSRGRPLDFVVMGMLRDEFDERYGAYEEVGAMLPVG